MTAARGLTRRTLAVLFLPIWLAAGCAKKPPSTVAGLPSGEGSLTYIQIDVGQGDSALLVSPDRHAMLVDAGVSGSEEAIREVIRRTGVERIDYLVETHPHADHIGGMIPLLRGGLPVDQFLLSGYIHGESPVQKSLLKTVKERLPGKSRRVKIGDRFSLGKDVEVEVLQPRSPFLRGTDDDANNNSVVLRVRYGRTAFLLTGDMGEEERDRLLESGQEIRADVLKVPHHGSKGELNNAFMDRVRPSVALISASVGNDYLHPRKEAIEHLESAGASIYRTDLQGDITVTSDGQKVTVHPERKAPVPVTLDGRQTAARLARIVDKTGGRRPSAPGERMGDGSRAERMGENGRGKRVGDDHRGRRQPRSDTAVDAGTGDRRNEGRSRASGDRGSNAGVDKGSTASGSRSRVNAERDAGSRNGASENRGSIIGNRRTRIYHMPDGGTRLPSPENRVYFDTERKARDAGYRRAGP